MKKKMSNRGLSMFKPNLGFPMNASAQEYVKSKDFRKNLIRQSRPSKRGSGNPNAYQGGEGGGMGPGGEEGGRGEE
jgi:hypothetical protein